MPIQTISIEGNDLIPRFAQDPSFALQYLETVLRAGTESERQRTCTLFLLAFDEAFISPQLIDTITGQVILENAKRFLSDATREIVIS